MKKIALIWSLCFIIIILLVVFKNKENNRSEVLKEDLAVYVNDELKDSIPSKEEAIFYKATCDSNTEVSWNNDSWSLFIGNMNQKTKCNLYFYNGETVFDFDYTGGEQAFTVPVSGTYKVELWGAQGGSYGDYIGGRGGYTSGTIRLERKSNLFIYVGEQGNCNTEYVSDTPTNKNENAINTLEYENGGIYIWPYKYYKGNIVWNNGAYPSKLDDGVGCT